MTEVVINITKDNYCQPARNPIGNNSIIRLSKGSYWLYYKRIKNKSMVSRLLRKKFTPYLIASNFRPGMPYEIKIDLRPYNF